MEGCSSEGHQSKILKDEWELAKGRGGGWASQTWEQHGHDCGEKVLSR